ncbi:MAG: hypothetical protein IJJ11_04465 [Methanosphaera sp.]|nr:hypothetical protein [Methanosphaera sp.]
MKFKNILFFLFIFSLIISLTSISAIEDNDSTIDKSIDNQKIEVEKSNQNLITSKEVKTSSKTIILNNTNFNNYVTNSKFNENVSDGDTIDIDGKLDSGNFDLTINKPVNIISSKNNSYISLNSSSASTVGSNGKFIINTEGSGSNITGLYFYNTHISVENTTNVHIDNITFINENQSIGSGVGAISVRDGSENISITNSYFKTEFNGGHSNVVFAVAYNCLFENNTVEGYGNNIGNLFYLTTYNVDTSITPYTNINITIRNNKIQTINTSKNIAICVGMVLEGRGHIIENNIISRSGTAIMAQYSDSEYGTVTELDRISFINNTVYEGTSSLSFPGIVANNTFNAFAGVSKAECSNNRFNNVTISNNIYFHNNIANSLQINGDNNTVDNNTFFTDKEYVITLTGDNNILSNNSIGSLNGRGSAAINNSTMYININNDKPATFVLTLENKDNYLDQVLNNKGKLIEYSLKDNLFIDDDTIIFNITLLDLGGKKISDTYNYYGNIRLNVFNSTNIMINISNVIIKNSLSVASYGNTEAYDSHIYQSGNITYSENSYIYDKNICPKPNQIVLYSKNIKTLINEDINEDTEIVVITHKNILNVTLPVNITGMYQLFENLNIVSFTNNVSFNEGSENTNVTNCSFIDNGRVHPSVNINTDDITFTDCLFNATVKVNANNIKFNNCTFYQELTLNDTSNVNIINCTFDTINTPISVYNSARVTITDNIINTSSSNTITFDEDSDKTTNTVRNNQLITSSYLGNDNVISQTKVKVENNIPRYPTQIQVEYPETMFKDEIVTINASVINTFNNTPVDSGFVEVYVNGVLLTNDTLNNGITSFNFSYPENNRTIPLKIWYYDTNNKYEDNVNKVNIQFTKTNITIEVEDFNAKLNENTTITATFKDERDNPIQNGNATFTISNLKYKSEINNGVATITEKVTEKWLDKNTFTISIAETDYNIQSQTKFPLNTQKGDVIINKTSLTTDESITLNLTIKNILDENINEGTITITDENNNILNQTDVENGAITINFQLPENSNRNININYVDAEYYQSTTEELYIPHSTKITISSPEKAMINKNTPITITLEDENNQPLANQEILLTINNEPQTITTNEQGTYTYNYTPTEVGDITITAKFNNTNEYTESENTITITVIETKLTVNSINSQIGQKINITARILANNETYTSINSGKITFKVNGKALKDANGKVIYAKVVNGTATIEGYEIPASWAKEDTTIEAVYTGSSQCNKLTSEKVNLTVTKAVPTLTTSDITATAGETITLTAQVTDNDKVINTGKVVFKINGKTVKDENGKVIYAKVTNNQANITYTLPENMKAKDYNITAVFTATNYDKLEDVKTLTITA